MITRFLPWVGAVAVAWTCTPATGQSTPAARPSLSLAPAPDAAAHGSGGLSWERPGAAYPGPGSLRLLPGEGMGGQDQYSNPTMFANAHGDFMLKRERWRPTARVSMLFQPNQGIDSEEGDFDLLHGEATIEKQFPVYQDGYLIAGAEFHHRHYLSDLRATRDGQQFAVGDQDLYGAGLIVGGGFFLQDDLLVEGVLRPGYRSDFDGTLHGKDGRIYARTRVEWRVQEDLFLKAGVDYDETYRDVNILPLIGLSWIPIDEWRVDVMLPKYAEVTYQYDNYLAFTLGIDVTGEQYHVRSSAETFKRRSDISVQEIRVGLGGSYRFDDRMSVFGKIGVNVAGDYKFGDASDRNSLGNSDIADGTLEPAVFFYAGFGYEF